MKVELSKKYYEQEFIPFFKKHGYDKVTESIKDHNLMAVITRNSVKVEMKWVRRNDSDSLCILIDYQKPNNKKPIPEQQ